jgi:Tfp pilus assembly protein PilE
VLHPYRAFSDIDLIIIVSVVGILVLVAYESKASPGRRCWR